MDSLTWLLHAMFSLLLGVSILLEFHGYYVKTSATLDTQSRSLSLSNWIVYLARILNICCAFILAVALELGSELKLSIIFLLGFLIGSVLCSLYWKTSIVEELCRYLLGRLIFLSHSSVGDCRYWRPVRLNFSKHSLGMVVAAGAAYCALILPFYVARTFPEFRMTAVYTGQILNFISTLALLGFIEPRMMMSLDRANSTSEDTSDLDGFISGRLWLTVILTFACGIWILVFSE